MSWRTLRLVCVCGLLAFSAAPACGGSTNDLSPSNAGSGGSGAHSGAGTSGNGTIARAGTAGMANISTVQCGSKTCTGVATPIQSLYIPPCCSDPATSHCGLDSSALAMFGATFGESCQPLAQPGSKDATCPESPSTPVEGTGFSITLPGCCRPNHTCGYQLDSVGGVLRVGLGCVDATPFLGGEAPQACGDTGAAGAAGASSAGGAGGDSSAASAGSGGDSSAAGESSSGDAGGAGAGG